MRLKKAVKAFKEEENKMPNYSVSWAANCVGSTAYHVNFPGYRGRCEMVFVSGGNYTLPFNKNPKYSNNYHSIDEAARAIWERGEEEDQIKLKAEKKQQRRERWHKFIERFKFKNHDNNR